MIPGGPNVLADAANLQRAAEANELQALIAAALTDLAVLLVDVQLLVDSRQRGLGFLTVEGRKVMDDLVRKEHQARYDNRMLALKITGDVPAPVGVAAVSLTAEVHDYLADLAARLVAKMRDAGVCYIGEADLATWERAGRRSTPRPRENATTADLVRRVAELVRPLAAPARLRPIHRDLEDLVTRARRIVTGGDIKAHPEPCPHCGLPTLVVYLDEGLIRCERDPHTALHQACICNDTYCACRTNAGHRHEWHRDKGSQKWGWYGLRQDQQLAARRHDEDTTEGATP